MKISPIPKNERERLFALESYHILDTDEEKDFDDIVVLASEICNTPISVMTLVDEKRQWFKAKTGWSFKETDRNLSFCAHTIHYDDIMMIPDTLQDDRFIDNPLVTEDPAIRFYAGMPLITTDGYKLGTLAVIDRKPGTLSEEQLSGLRILGRQVVNLLNLRLNLLQQGSLIKEKTDEVTKIFERITDAFVALDKNWCYTYLNSKAEQIFNKPNGYLIGKHIWTEFPEGIDQTFYKAYHRAMAEQQYIHVEEYYPPYDKWFENHIYPSPDGLSVFFRDITEKKKREEALKEKNSFIESIINASPDIIYIYDIEESKNVYVNEGIQLNLGYTNEEIKLMGDQVIPILMHPEDFDYYLQNIFPKYETLKDKDVITNEFRLRHRNGSLHWLFTKESIFLRNPDGTPKQIFGVSTDITERKEGEENLREADQRLTQLLYNTPLAIIEWDKNFIIQKWSPLAENIFGWKEAEVVNKHFNELNLVFEEDAVATGIIAQELMTGEVDQNKNINRNNTKAGKIIYCQWFNSVLKDEKGNVNSILSLIQDITEGKKADLLLSGEKKVLEMIAAEKPLQEILDTVALNYESYSDNALCSILLLDAEGTNIRHGAGPSLPDAYNKGIDGEPIGPVAGSCGTAAYRKERVIVSDIATDPLWVNYRDFALGFGLKASWSTPIINAEGKVYATFAIYYKECRTPGDTDLTLIDQAANQVKIVLERYYKDTRIKESEEKYRALVTATSDILYRMSPDWSVMHQFDGRGFIADNLKPNSNWFQEYIHPNDQAHVMSVIKEAIRTKSIFELEHPVFQVDGTLGWTFSRAVPLFDAKGDIVEWFGAASNITDRKKAEEELRLSESRTKKIFEAGMIGFIFWDANGEILDANDFFLAMTGYSKKDLMEKKIHWNKMTPPEYAELDRRGLEQIALTGICQPFEKEYLRKDGSRLQVLLGASSFEGNSPEKGVAYVMDITERKKAEQSLTESEEKYRTLVEQASDAIFIADTSGRFITVNTSACKLAQYSKEKLLQMSIHDFAVMEDIQKNPFHFDELRDGKTVITERVMKGKDAVELNVEITAKLLSDGRLLTFVRDITKRKKAEEEIYNLNESLEHRVKERTSELEKTNVELEEINDLFVGREARIIELKEELEALKMKLK